MVAAEELPACLDALWITVTQSTEPDPDSNISLEFLTVEPTARAAFIADEGTAGILYLNNNKEFVAASMAWQPRNKELRKWVVIAQQGNSLAHGDDPILFPVKELNSHVLVPMYKADAEELKLVCDPLLLTKENCLLPSPLVFETHFTGGKEVVLAVLPTVLAVGYGGLLPDASWDKCMEAMVSEDTKTSITGGKPQKGLAAAYAMLKANDYHSYLWVEEAPFGVKRDVLHLDFIKSSMPNMNPNMCLGTAACGRGTPHRATHQENYMTFLRRGMARRRVEDAVSYNTIIAKYTVKEPIQRPRSPDPADNESEGEESPPGKKQKVEEVYNKDPFYRCLLGSMKYTTIDSMTNMTTTSWLPRPALHVKLMKALLSPGTANVLEVQSIRKKFDKLLKVRLPAEFWQLPEYPIPINHSMMSKLKNKRWSTENLTDEVASMISLACFTPLANKKEAIEIQNEAA